MVENWIIAVGSGITALATIGIVIYAAVSYRLTQAIKDRDDQFREFMNAKDEEFRQQVKDLYQGIIVGTMVSSPVTMTEASTMQGRIKWFKEHYTGQTKIF